MRLDSDKINYLKKTSMTEQKTKPTEESVKSFLNKASDEGVRDDCFARVLESLVAHSVDFLKKKYPDK